MNQRTKNTIKKIILFSIPVIIALSIIYMCTNKPKLKFTTLVTLSNSEGNTKAIVFSSNVSWNAKIRYKDTDEIGWLNITPDNGPAGENILLTIGTENSIPQTRSAYVDIQYGDKTETLVVVQNSLGAPKLLSAPRITWDASKQQYSITYDPTDAGLYFKKGGVVGIFSGPGRNADLGSPNSYENDSPFDAIRDIPFNMTNARKWEDVPKGGGSEANNHNVNNVKAGKGDPCRLVGLDLNKIKNSSVASLITADIDNKLWRMPTEKEAAIFSGQTEVKNSSNHWWNAEHSPYSGVAGGEFPSRSVSGGNEIFLPAAGVRLHLDGSVKEQGMEGYYWSCGNKDLMTFRSTQVVPYNQGDYRLGCPIRCVRQ